jgi:hypothetical protein
MITDRVVGWFCLKRGVMWQMQSGCSYCASKSMIRKRVGSPRAFSRSARSAVRACVISGSRTSAQSVGAAARVEGGGLHSWPKASRIH